MFSIYTTIFNIDKEFYSDDFIKDAINNFKNFVGEEGEVVISIPKSEKTSEKINILDNLGVKIVFADVNKENIYFVGQLKNIALQCTTRSAKISLDLDERIPIRQKPLWEEIFRNNRYPAFFIHSLDLWGSIYHIKDDLSFYENKFKWYLHRDFLFRGAVNFGKLKNGIDISKTDTCELIDSSGNLPPCFPIKKEDGYYDVQDYLDFIENEGLFVYHLGYADLDSRLKLNKEWWRDFKTKRNSGEEPFDIKTTKEDLNFPTIKHNLPLWNE